MSRTLSRSGASSAVELVPKQAARCVLQGALAWRAQDSQLLLSTEMRDPFCKAASDTSMSGRLRGGVASGGGGRG